MSIVNGTICKKTVDGVTYGIEIIDLQRAFPSARRDLMLLHVEDDGVQDWVDGDADDPDTLTIGEEEIDCAFAVADATAATRTGVIGLPSGSSGPQNRTTSDDRYIYEKGDLIFGRRPRWNLWADNVNVGKYIEVEGGANLYGHYCYNLYHTPSLTAGRKLPCLQHWNGYNRLSHHDPYFMVNSGEIALEYHNQQMVRADLADAFFWGNVSVPADDSVAFPYDENSGVARCVVRLGNLADWFRTTRLDQLYFYGFVVRVTATINNVVTEVCHVLKTQSGQANDVWLGANTSAADIALYRDGLSGGEDYLHQMDGVGDLSATLYSALSAATGGQIEAEAELLLYSAPGDTEVQKSHLISLEYILPKKPVPISASFDPKTRSTSSSFRMFLKNIDAETGWPKCGDYYVIPASRGNGGQSFRTVGITGTDGGIHFAFWLSTALDSTGTIVTDGPESFMCTLNISYLQNGSLVYQSVDAVVSHYTGTASDYGTKGTLAGNELGNTPLPSGHGALPTYETNSIIDVTKGYAFFVPNSEICGSGMDVPVEACAVITFY